MKKVAKIGYSLRSKITPPQPEAEKVPGPGTCTTMLYLDKENNFFNQTGTLFVSKHANHKASRFDSGGLRFKGYDNPNPGPGNYDTSSTEFSKLGKYSLSCLQSSKVRSFGHAQRIGLANRCQSIISCNISPWSRELQGSKRVRLLHEQKAILAESKEKCSRGTMSHYFKNDRLLS